MATTSSRQTSLFGLQDWVRQYQSYASADFQAYDYTTLRNSFIDYMTRNYPETFNDYTESSEMVALLDVISFMGQSLAFRSDLNAREGFLDTAERRDSVVKLANLVSYNPKRNTAGQGLVKVNAISTSEDLSDINGVNLSNTTILWNDPANSSWQEQFNTIINATLVNSQRVGRPGNTQNILNIKTDEYSINTLAGRLPVVPYQSEIDGSVMNFELVSSTSLNQQYLYELPPAPSSQFNILYRNDKMGYGSMNTGFFFYFKQGTLQSQDINFPEKIENNFQSLDVQGINDTDTWLYKLTDSGSISELWTQAESVYTGLKNSQGQSIKSIFSVTSRANDEVSYVFSDGVFGEIPYGLFRAYFRSSNALQYTIDPAEMSGITASIPYVSRVGSVETLTFTFSLQTPSNTAQARESLASIKERAPARYYTQNRMVNGEDYVNFPFTLYNSIIKSKAINRTSIGITRGLDLLDPTGKYSSTNVFAGDGAVYFDDIPDTTSFSTLSTVYATEFLSSTLPVLLSTPASVQYYQQYYPWYSGAYPRANAMDDDSCYWSQTTVSGSQVTGYFYILDSAGTVERPIAVGEFSSETMRYITKGAQVKFQSPVGKWFDANNRLTTVDTGITSIWVGVVDVVGDGYNYGSGDLPTGLGPITLNAHVPSGAFLVKTPSIIAQFDNTLGNKLVVECLNRVKLKQDFVLKFDNSVLATQERWSVSDDFSSLHFVSFVHSQTDSSYTVTVKNANYTFGSVAEARFMYDGDSRVYDPRSGQVIRDFVNILKANAIPKDTNLNVVGQPVQSDGYANDFEIAVSSVNPNTGFTANPEFFTDIVGGTTVTNADNAVFFTTSRDSNGIITMALLPAGAVEYGSTATAVATGVYEYPVGTVTYAPYALQLQVVRAGFTVTASTIGNVPHYLVAGDEVTITGFAVDDYNGTHVVVDVPTPETFTYVLATDTAVATISTGNLYNRFYQSSVDNVVDTGTRPVVYKIDDVTGDYAVQCGRGGLSFQYRHNSGETTRIDPATTNIIDLYLVTQAYYTNYTNWLADTSGQVSKPQPPTMNELQQAYGELEAYKMISDTVVLNSVAFKPLFGDKAEPNLQGTIKVIKSATTTASDSQIRSSVLSAMNAYFSIDNWNFGETLYFSELTAYLHVQLGNLISSVILVPANPASRFGALYEIRSAPNEIFVNCASIQNITVISALTASNMQR